MADNSHMDSRLWSIPSSFHNGRIVSFQSGAVNSVSDVISGDISNSMASMFMSGNSGIISNVAATGLARSTSSTVLSEPTMRFPHVSGSPAYWSSQEINTLFEGLARHANESTTQKYTKIAAMLPNKTIRDVALRCQWMSNQGNGKRRKTEGYIAKRVKDTKKMSTLAGTSNVGTTSSEPLNATTNQVDLSNHFPSGALVGEVKHLLDQNAVLLQQIEANLTDNANMNQIPNNVDLFLHTQKNIRAAEDRVNKMPNLMVKCPGQVSKLPPLPESVNEELLKHALSFDRTVKVAQSAQVSSSFQLDPRYFRPNRIAN